MRPSNHFVGFHRSLTGLFVGGALALLSGCAPATPPAPPSPPLKSLDLFMTRSSLTSTEFEQYSLSEDSLFGECGVVERGKFIAQTQKVAALSPEMSAALAEASCAVLRSIEGRKLSFDPPGTKPSPLDPGAFALKTGCGDTPVEVKTSFDTVVNGETKQTEALGKLTRLVRLAAVEGCGGRTFFGLTPLKP